MDLILLIGFLAAACSMASFVPQALKIARSHDTASISMMTYILNVIGFSLWLAYGFFKSEWPLILTNSICLGFSVYILSIKFFNVKGHGAE